MLKVTQQAQPQLVLAGPQQSQPTATMIPTAQGLLLNQVITLRNGKPPLTPLLPVVFCCLTFIVGSFNRFILSFSKLQIFSIFHWEFLFSSINGFSLGFAALP